MHAQYHGSALEHRQYHSPIKVFVVDYPCVPLSNLRLIVHFDVVASDLRTVLSRTRHSGNESIQGQHVPQSWVEGLLLHTYILFACVFQVQF